jgi:hypothetical protein
LIYLSALLASRAGTSRWRPLWRVAFYVVALVASVILIDPRWLLQPERLRVAWGAGLLYPLAVSIGAVLVSLALKSAGDAEGASRFRRQMLRGVIVMWASLAVWVIAIYLLVLIGFVLAW